MLNVVNSHEKHENAQEFETPIFEHVYCRFRAFLCLFVAILELGFQFELVMTTPRLAGG